MAKTTLKPIKILTTGDNHHGSVLGLTPPKWWSDVNRSWAQKHWDKYVELVKANGPYDVHVRNGDLLDGPGRKESGFSITTDINQQIEMAIASGSVVKADRTYIVRGTGFHVDMLGAGTNFETMIGDILSVPVVDELRLEVYGRRLHWRHHVGRSDVPYGQYTQLGRETIREMLESDLEGYDDADALYRNHVHYAVKIGLFDELLGHWRQAMTCPCLQLRAPLQSGFHRKLRTIYYHVGITVTTIYPDGRIEDEVKSIPIKLTAPNHGRYECLTPSSK